MTTEQNSPTAYKVQSGFCPDDQCNAKLFFPARDVSIECTSCGQRHLKEALKNVEDVTNPGVALHNILKNILLGATKPKKGSDTVRVQGVSNYQCKLLSPFLTTYGMDKQTGKAIPLTQMSQKEMFDCSILGERNFLLEPELIEVNGYGRDRTGSMNYLKDTLDEVKLVNDGNERLLPIHADGDGHCLVHAVSRALVGRELFWHALRANLKCHFLEQLNNYKALFKDFIHEAEWNDIIDECDPEFIPREGEPLGLRNIHILGLAHILRRPIILLDSMHGLSSSGDYTGVFIPGLIPKEKCFNKNGKPNPPICLAWSNRGRNHYIALVGVKGRPVPKIPPWMIPKAWGMPQELVNAFIQRDEKGNYIVGGEKSLQDKYVLRLANAMEELFFDTYNVSTALVADMHQFVYKSQGMAGIHHQEVLQQTQLAVNEGRLYRCLTCDAVNNHYIPPEWLRPGGKLYDLAVSIHKKLYSTKKYSFPMEGVVCSYDEEKDILELDRERSKVLNCSFCQGSMMRPVRGNGKPVYINGDRTSTRTTSSRCQCGYKHYWQGQEYDNLPEVFPISLEWNGKVVGEKVVWFQYESDSSLNSNVYEVAQGLVQKHFPGEFGSERLVQKVVDTIMRQTAAKEVDQPAAAAPQGEDPLHWQPDTATKVIMTGHHSKTMHKEELSASAAEKNVKKKVEANAPVSQRKKSDQLERQQGGKGKATPGSPIKHSAKQQKTEADPQLHQSSSPQSPPPAPSSSSMPPSKKVRVTTSDGRQLALSLESGLTFTQLRQKLETELGVPPERQNIKHGFPPKVLAAPETSVGEEEPKLPLQHGDRLTVEILPDANAVTDVPIRPPVDPWPAKPPTKHSWSHFDPSSHDASDQQMLQGLESLQDANHDRLDTAIASLALMATLTGKDVWTYVQGMPHLFSVGGLFYQQVNRDLGLVDGKHCKLTVLPGKTFRYSSTEDRLELCLEPHGHFQVEPGIEDKVLKTSLMGAVLEQAKAQHQPNVSEALSAGSSGIVVNQTMKMGAIPFTGHGHSLSSSSADAHMPRDLAMGSGHHHKSRSRKSSDSSQRLTQSISEDGEEEEELKMEDDSDVSMKRLGPGFSVVDQSTVNQFNQTADALQRLASQIESIVEDDDGEDEVMVQDGQSEDVRTEGVAATSQDPPPASTTVPNPSTSNSNDRESSATDLKSDSETVASVTCKDISCDMVENVENVAECSQVGAVGDIADEMKASKDSEKCLEKETDSKGEPMDST